MGNGIKLGKNLSLRGAAGDEAISFANKDRFAALAMTTNCHPSTRGAPVAVLRTGSAEFRKW
jgi:hypothetical protein